MALIKNERGKLQSKECLKCWLINILKAASYNERVY